LRDVVQAGWEEVATRWRVSGGLGTNLAIEL